MPRRWLAMIVHSVFLKLLMVIIIAGICINLAVGAFFFYITKDYMHNMPLRKNWVQYMSYLVRDIGEPPDMERARGLAQRLGITIGVEDAAAVWQTTGQLPDPATVEMKQISQAPPAYWARHEGRGLLMVEASGRRYMFDMVPVHPWIYFAEGKIAFLIVFLTCILIFSYIAIRLLLRPVRWLNEGVGQVSSGNLDYRMPVKRLDEFGMLAEAFNSMTGRISDMLRAREQLLLDVSHELRSPITRMKVALEFMPEAAAKQGLQADIHDMEAMISEIVETQRLGSPYGRLNREKTDLGELVREVVAERAHRSSAIMFENEQPAVTVMVDRLRMRTVLKNVVDNALKYSDAGSEPVRIAVFRKQPHIVVQVRDAGRGIPAEDLPHVFEPFYRVDKSRNRHTGGYGLGLSICRTIMEAHKGRIVIESEPGRGTTVSLLLPEAQQALEK